MLLEPNLMLDFAFAESYAKTYGALLAPEVSFT